MSTSRRLGVALTALWMAVVLILLASITWDVSNMALIVEGWQEFGIRQR